VTRLDPTRPVGLYVHVPFCRAICTYCAFAKEEYAFPRAELWLSGLEREIALRARDWGLPRVDTVFVGGGTPSALTVGQWERFGALLGGGFAFEPGCEFTSEANPESFTPEVALAMRAAGVNRVSLGAQSFDPRELQVLGRLHGVAEVERAVRTAREAGFDNLNLDLMYGLPEADGATFARTLDAVLALGPDHLSAYCLGLEPGTVLAEAVGGGAVPQPDDDRSREEYDTLVGRTAAAGLPAYELSNFAAAGRECRHNLKYWRRDDFLALGPSAHGLVRNLRWANPAKLEKWLDAYDPSGSPPALKPVPLPEARFEWVFLNLRLTGGFAVGDFESAWGEPFTSAYGGIAGRLAQRGWLDLSEGRVRLTRDAWFLSDGVFSEFAPAGERSV